MINIDAKLERIENGFIARMKDGTIRYYPSVEKFVSTAIEDVREIDRYFNENDEMDQTLHVKISIGEQEPEEQTGPTMINVGAANEAIDGKLDFIEREFSEGIITREDRHRQLSGFNFARQIINNLLPTVKEPADDLPADFLTGGVKT